MAVVKVSVVLNMKYGEPIRYVFNVLNIYCSGDVIRIRHLENGKLCISFISIYDNPDFALIE